MFFMLQSLDSVVGGWKLGIRTRCSPLNICNCGRVGLDDTNDTKLQAFVILIILKLLFVVLTRNSIIYKDITTYQSEDLLLVNKQCLSY